MAGSRRQYPFHLIEPKWQKTWDEQQAFRAFNPGDEIPASHPFAQRHQLSGKVTAAQLPAKYYILDMFPYPSGAGLHVGHPEGYTATDILARYRRACGFNVLHPMGWDSFGLPAEQYAVKTGQHPRVTTEANIANFTRQIKSLGFSYDWTRELATTDPDYFKWTQWIFLKLYNSWFNPESNRAEPIDILKDVFSEDPKRRSEWGKNSILSMLRKEWEITSEKERQNLARLYTDQARLAYVSDAPVWWCEELGTVLSNEEVVDGKSEVGGFSVVRKPMRQWMLSITEYAERLLEDLDSIDWSDSLKEMQRNWIGRSEGAEVVFPLLSTSGGRFQPGGKVDERITVFTTRPDTLFGATYMVLSPEHRLVPRVTSAEQRQAVENYKAEVVKKSDLERTELAKEKTGVFTGAYAINPVNGEKIPIWIADYVLASYGTGAIMAVPAHDERDSEFAKKFSLKIQTVIEPSDRAGFFWRRHQQGAVKGAILPNQESWVSADLFDKNGKGLYQWDERTAFTYDGIASECVNSANAEVSLNGLPTAEAKKKITDWLEAKGLGQRTINYKLRDWLFSRQRYWGEPFPILWKKDVAGNLYHEALPESVDVWKRLQDGNLVHVSKESVLPIYPPQLDDYKPTPEGQPPLARAKDWVNFPDGSTRETNTMPQWAGSCWYYLRYLDAKNAQSFVGKEAEQYWMGSLEPKSTPGVDLYVGGTEHAVLHLLYARFWHKVLFDLGHVSTPEPFFKLVNQGLILGEIEYFGFKRTPDPKEHWISVELVTDISSSGGALTGKLKSDGTPVFGFKLQENWVEAKGGQFILKSLPDVVIEARSFKMSKSRGNVVNPDDVLKEFGADAFRLYEMFMGPLQDTKPWNTRGVEGVYRFLGRVWRLFVDELSETEFEQAETTAESAEQRKELLNLIKLSSAIKDVSPTPAQLKTLHACIKKVTEDLDGMRFNTAISAMMVFVNDAMTWETKPVSVLKTFLQLLAPFAPHLAEELWSKVSGLMSKVPTPADDPTTSDFGLQTLDSLAYSPWPKFDPALLVEDTLEIPVQVNGKLRDVIRVSATATPAALEAAALANEKVKPFLAGKTIKKIIVLPKRLVNIVVT